MCESFDDKVSYLFNGLENQVLLCGYYTACKLHINGVLNEQYGVLEKLGNLQCLRQPHQGK